MTLTVIDTRPDDPTLDARITAAILERVAAGEDLPEATRAVCLGAIDEVRETGWMGQPEVEFIIWHVFRLGSGRSGTTTIREGK
jgi:hypothetical protein